MRMRRIILTVLLVAILAALGGGAWYVFVYRTSGDKLLKRAGVAYTAGDYDKAIDLARRYAARNPDDVRAIRLQARAYSTLGQYAKARDLLQEALKRTPGDVDLVLSVTDTYRLPARETLTSNRLTTDRLREVSQQLTRALDILKKASPADDAARMRVQEAAGLTWANLGNAKRRLAAAIRREADVHDAANQKGPANAKRREARTIEQEAQEAQEQATDLLLAVLTWDAAHRQDDQPLAHPAAADRLVLLATDPRRRDVETLAKVRDILLALPDPPLVAATRLIIDPLEAPGAEPTEAQVRDAARQLDTLLEKHGDAPQAVQVRLARARCAYRLGDLDLAEDLCKAVLRTQPNQADARLWLALVRLGQGKADQAEKDLFALKTDQPAWPAAHFYYAQAAIEAGKGQPESKRELAKEALRKAINLHEELARTDLPGAASSQGLCRRARLMLGQMLLEEGFANEAFKEATQLCKTGPDGAPPEDGEALFLLAGAAAALKQPTLATDTLDKAAEAYPNHISLQAFLANGYRLLGEKTKAQAADERVAAGKAETPAERLAQAQAHLALGKTAEAERRLNALIADAPDFAPAHVALGDLYAATARGLQAVDQYRAAVDLAPTNTAYRLVLARTLLRVDLVDEAADEVRQVLERNPNHTDAKALKSRIAVLRGEPLDLDTLIASAPDAATSGLPLAQEFLNRGQPAKCIEICSALLQKTPDNAEALWLLGQAHLSLGQTNACVEDWTRGLGAAPDRVEFYQGLTQVLAREKTPDEVESTLSAIAGADPTRIGLAIGSLYRAGGAYAKAADVFRGIADRAGAPADLRHIARLRQAECLALAGQADDALAALDTLPKDVAWRSRTEITRAIILTATNRPDEARTVLENLRKTASSEASVANRILLTRIGTLYLRTGQFEQALAVADDLARLFPKTTGPLSLRAAALEQMRRPEDALACLREIVALEPGNLQNHVRLAQALDLHGRPQEALAALEELRQHGPAGETLGLYLEGRLLAGCGLQAPALERLEALIAHDESASPQVRVLVAQALASVGNVAKARDQLAKVPSYAREYAVAQQLLAQLADTDDERLALLAKAAAGQPPTSPATGNLVLQRMNILMDAGRPADAAKAFADYESRLPKGVPPSGRLARRAIDALLAAGDPKAAAALAVRTARQGNNLVWRRLAALLAVRDEPATAADLLPKKPAEAEAMDAVLGAVVAFHRGEGLRPWLARMDEIDRTTMEAQGRPGIPPAYRVLALLATGDTSAAARHATVPAPAGQTSVIPDVMLEMIASAKTNPDAIRKEAVQVALASLANDLGLGNLGHAWAMEALKARPKSRWAAAVAAEGVTDPARLRAILNVLDPADCLIGRVIQATALALEGKHAEAASAYEAIIRDHGPTPQLLMSQAVATEKAGRLGDALSLYSTLWDQTRDPTAANNAAYLMAREHPKDTQRLTVAAGWAADAVKARPDASPFRDTKGWLHYLLGQNEDALRELRTAVKGIPDSPEVHYHLGMAEKKAGNVEMARWHLEAAVRLGEAAAKQAGGADTSAEATPGAEAARLARQALEDLPTPPEGT